MFYERQLPISYRFDTNQHFILQINPLTHLRQNDLLTNITLLSGISLVRRQKKCYPSGCRMKSIDLQAFLISLKSSVGTLA